MNKPQIFNHRTFEGVVKQDFEEVNRVEKKKEAAQDERLTWDKASEMTWDEASKEGITWSEEAP